MSGCEREKKKKNEQKGMKIIVTGESIEKEKRCLGGCEKERGRMARGQGKASTKKQGLSLVTSIAPLSSCSRQLRQLHNIHGHTPIGQLSTFPLSLFHPLGSLERWMEATVNPPTLTDTEVCEPGRCKPYSPVSLMANFLYRFILFLHPKAKSCKNTKGTQIQQTCTQTTYRYFDTLTYTPGAL